MTKEELEAIPFGLGEEIHLENILREKVILTFFIKKVH